MRFSIPLTLLPLLALADVALSVCPGFNYAIGNVQDLGSGYSLWRVYDADCNAVDGLTTNLNPCTSRSGIFGCSPPPILFNRYKNTYTGIVYTCRTDPNSGVCGNDVISVCCRNDGR
ncbi:hypothetical protein BDN72DRAFT_507493 [Pluteus cervinus]|uniref:Uncharacterized protein n=1 Tax=Pluteus cervinus TaxID=181527 RepID=A0ACD3A6Z9_9AGAR|nr:hypothetical protein BDN72DRAFT_507493 [Pluteus cervinus]